MQRRNGFTLLELLIVVAIILIIAAIAVPNLLRSRIAANEASAVESMRTINTAEIIYNTIYPASGFTCNLPDLGPPTGGSQPSSSGAGLIDGKLSTGVKSGYNFVLTSCPTGSGSSVAVSYNSTADPSSPGRTGQRYFCSDNTGVIKHDGTSSANCITNGIPI